ncbi:MAG: hypothetical protein WDO18_04535 [Acidobacteriota bacterium]
MKLNRCLLGTVIAAAFTLIPAQAEVGKSTLIDPNLAPERDLAALPHMTPALVKGILDKRPFLTMANSTSI